MFDLSKKNEDLKSNVLDELFECREENVCAITKYDREKIPEDAVMCTHCGRQVEQLKSEQPQVVINNSNANTNMNTNINRNYGTYRGGEKNKWVALLLCIFLGYLGAHKFYEGKILLGIVYLCTFGLFGIGWVIDCISLLFKPNPYYV